MMSTRSDLNPARDLGPFDGEKAGYTRVLTSLLAFEWLMLLVLPWFLALAGSHSHARGFLAALPLGLWKVGFLDLLGVATAASFWTLQKRLSARIANGGAEAVFLDQVRYRITSLVLGLVLLMIVSLVFAGSRS